MPVRKESLAAAARAFEKFHWGRTARRLLRVQLPPGPRLLIALGELRAVTYRTGKGDDSIADYVHDFRRPAPLLALDPERGDLHIVRGRSRYHVTEKGIEG